MSVFSIYGVHRSYLGFETMRLFKTLIPTISILFSGCLGYASSDFDSTHEDYYLGDTNPVSTPSDSDIYHDSVEPTIPGQPVKPASSDDLIDDFMPYEISDSTLTSSEKPDVTLQKAKKSSSPVPGFPVSGALPVLRIPKVTRGRPVCDPVWFVVLCCIGGRIGVDMDKCRYCTCLRPQCLFQP